MTASVFKHYVVHLPHVLGGSCRCAQAGTYTPGSPAQLLQLASTVNNNSHGVGAAQASRDFDVICVFVGHNLTES